MAQGKARGQDRDKEAFDRCRSSAGGGAEEAAPTGERSPAFTDGARTPKKGHPVLFKSKREIFEFIEQNRNQFPIRMMCAFYGVSKSGYYRWTRRVPSARDKEDAMLLKEIQRIHKDSGSTYGSPRIHAELQNEGRRMGRKRIARLMQIDGIRGRSSDLYYANPGLGKYYAEIPNRKKDVVVTAPNQVWVGDVTYLKLGKRWLYLAVVMDQFSRKILGWALGRDRTSALTLRAISQAIRRRKPGKGIIFHSDRGCEYAARVYRNRLATAGFIQSMNRPRRMTDNAHMESFFHSMKSDVIHRVAFYCEADYERVIRKYMPYYNNTRRHSALNYRSPANYEIGLAA